jgi:hypothetical protein
MTATRDDVTDLLVALVTAHRSGLSSVEVNAILQSALADYAESPEQREWMLSFLVGALVAHYSAVLAEWDRMAGRPLADRWIAAIVEIAAESRA